MSVSSIAIVVHIASPLIQNWIAPSIRGLGIEEMAASLENDGEFFLFVLDGLSAWHV